MTLAKIVVTDIIKTGSLFAEEEGNWDVNLSAENLAEAKGQAIVDYLDEKYPGVEIYADIAIQAEAGSSRPLEVLFYFGENESFPVEAPELREELTRLIAERTAGREWAVKS